MEEVQCDDNRDKTACTTGPTPHPFVTGETNNPERLSRHPLSTNKYATVFQGNSSHTLILGRGSRSIELPFLPRK